MSVSLDDIKRLRQATGVSVSAVKQALESAEGNFEKATVLLREKGLLTLEKRGDKVASNGMFGVYVHNNGRFVVVVFVSCETDFAVNSEEFKLLCKSLALHVAAKSPKYLNVESIEPEVIDQLEQGMMDELKDKSEEIKKNIIRGKLDKFFSESVLMKQTCFFDESKTVEQYLQEVVAKLGEKIKIEYFYRFGVKEGVHASR